MSSAISAQKKLLSGLVVVKKKRTEIEKKETLEKTERTELEGTKKEEPETPAGGLSLLGGYGSGSSGSGSE